MTGRLDCNNALLYKVPKLPPEKKATEVAELGIEGHYGKGRTR